MAQLKPGSLGLLWLAAAVGATVFLVAVAFSLAKAFALPSVILGHLASLPVLAWFLALRRLTRFGQRWPGPAWFAAALLAYLAVGLAYMAIRLAFAEGGVYLGYTAPLIWPAMTVRDVGCALDLAPCGD